jgi:hypothetical protein
VETPADFICAVVPSTFVAMAKVFLLISRFFQEIWYVSSFDPFVVDLDVSRLRADYTCASSDTNA